MAADPVSSRGWTGPFLVDTHVHLHPCFEVAPFFDAAERNFRQAALSDGSGSMSTSAAGVLVFTEGAREKAFPRLADGSLVDPLGRWWFDRGGDELSVVASSRDGTRVLIVAGRQIVSRERLEVLLVGSRAPIPDGRSFRDTLYEAAADRGVPVVPWGFGKWWGERGRVVREGLESVDPGKVFVADGGGRPRSLALHPLMRWAVGRGHGLLLGTDPLPLRGQTERAGKCGIVLQGTLSPDSPADDLVALIRRSAPGVTSYGSRDGWLDSAIGQVSVRLPLRRSGGAK